MKMKPSVDQLDLFPQPAATTQAISWQKIDQTWPQNSKAYGADLSHSPKPSQKLVPASVPVEEQKLQA